MKYVIPAGVSVSTAGALAGAVIGINIIRPLARKRRNERTT
jgi:hypothetical protein